MLLVVLPFLELRHRHVDVEFGIVGHGAKVAHIITLEVDLLEGVLQSLLALHPNVVILLHLRLGRQLDPAEDHIPRIPSLRIEHRERIKLILHPEISDLRIIDPEDAFVEMGRVHAVMGA